MFENLADETSRKRNTNNIGVLLTAFHLLNANFDYSNLE